MKFLWLHCAGSLILRALFCHCLFFHIKPSDLDGICGWWCIEWEILYCHWKVALCETVNPMRRDKNLHIFLSSKKPDIKPVWFAGPQAARGGGAFKSGCGSPPEVFLLSKWKIGSATVLQNLCGTHSSYLASSGVNRSCSIDFNGHWFAHI